MSTAGHKLNWVLTSSTTTAATDLSASCETEIVELGSCRDFALQQINPATDTPTGAYTLWVGMNKADKSTFQQYLDELGNNIFATQPAGAYNVILDNLDTLCPYFYVKYVRTSGGTGAAPTTRWFGKAPYSVT